MGDFSSSASTDAPTRSAAWDAAALVSVVGLSKRFSGTTALDALDLELRSGEVVGLLGPKRLKGVQSRVALEWQMMWRQGGKAQVIAFSALLLVATALLVWGIPAKARPQALQVFAGFAVYLGALQTIALAGRSARADLMARAFLAALPLSSHQVLDGKASALRSCSFRCSACSGW